MSWYAYHQNNSGGIFTLDKEDGITVYVVIEADNADEANSRAQDIGIYFNSEHDCPCCGPRWHKSCEGDATDTPKIYGQPVESVETYVNWVEDGYEIAVHPKNGPVQWFGVSRRNVHA